MTARAIGYFVLALGLAGCSQAAESEPVTQPPAANVLAVSTGEFEVPAGDSLTCFYTSTTTEKEIYIGDATGSQGPGGHHVLVYYTDVPHPVGHHPCVDSEMLAWHQVAGADTNKEPIIAIPPGAAVKVPAGKQIVIQSHYINTTGAAEMVDDKVNIALVEGKDIKQFLNFFAYVDSNFVIPPQMDYKSVTTCTVKSDLNTVIVLGHMHSLGKYFSLERIDESGAQLEMIYEQNWESQYLSHPPLKTSSLEKPYVIPAGTRLRQTCEWDNTSADTVTFPTEMCVSFMFYYPDSGFVECDGVPEAKP